MKQYKKYLIGANDLFDENNFSSVADEVRSINEKTNNSSQSLKVEILISFLKDHSLQDNWITINPELTDLITSGTLFTGNIEALFESSKENALFRKDLENYLLKEFTNADSVAIAG
jgi:hypothetical protein